MGLLTRPSRDSPAHTREVEMTLEEPSRGGEIHGIKEKTGMTDGLRSLEKPRTGFRIHKDCGLSNIIEDGRG